MLAELRIRNFALIDQLSVELGAGLIVLTGETGAGKSIIVGALGLLLGERASAEHMKRGCSAARRRATSWANSEVCSARGTLTGM